MPIKVDLQKTYVPSNDIVARDIEGELIIVPLVAGIADLEDDLFTLNRTGKDIWNRLDGRRNLETIVEELSKEYEGRREDIQEDVLGLVSELLKRRIIIES